MSPRSHPCDRAHRSYQAAARCIWPRATWIAGNGPHAVLSRCPHGPHATCLTIGLWPTARAAAEAKHRIDRLGCGGRCCGQHELVELAPL